MASMSSKIRRRGRLRRRIDQVAHTRCDRSACIVHICIDHADRVRYEAFVPVETAPPIELEDMLRKRVAELEGALTAMTEALTTAAQTLSKTSAALATVTAERDKLRHAYEQLKGQLELLRRRIFLAKAERIDTRQLEIEFAETKAKLDELAKELDDDGDATEGAGDDDTSGGDDGRPARTKKKPSGRRNLRELDIPEETPRSKKARSALASRRAASSAIVAAGLCAS